MEVSFCALQCVGDVFVIVISFPVIPLAFVFS